MGGIWMCIYYWLLFSSYSFPFSAIFTNRSYLNVWSLLQEEARHKTSDPSDKKAARQTKAGGGLFEEDDDDLFAEATSKPAKKGMDVYIDSLL